MHLSVDDRVIDVVAKPVGSAAGARRELALRAAWVHIVVTPHPVTLRDQRKLRLALGTAGADDSLAGLLKRCDVDLYGPETWVLAVGGVIVPRQHWARVKPRPGQLVEARVRAGEIITAIITAVSSWYAGLSTIAAFVVKGVFQLVGSLILNKLLAPPKKRAQPQQQVEQTYSVSSVQNQQRPYSMVPIVFGATRIGLDYFGQPYTSFEGGEQYYYGWFSAGVNGGSWSDAKLGTTALSAYTEATIAGMGFSQLADQAMLVYTNVDTFAGAQLINTGSPSALTRTTAAGTVMLALDFEGQVYGIDSQGAMAPDQFVDYFATYRQLPSGSALPFFDASNNQGLPEGSAANSVRIYSQSTKPLRNTFARAVPEGEYEVVVTKLTLDVTTTTASNISNLTALRGFQRDTSPDYRIGRFSVRMRASGQLNGAIEQLSVHVQQKPVPLWNGAAWVTTTTSNVGALLLQFIRGIYDNTGRLLAGYGYADSRIDLESFKGFQLHCAALGFEFNHWQAELISCEELAEQMARVGLGSLSRHTGKLGVIWFNETQPLEGVINMANIKRGSFSVDYYTGESVDELEISYSDQPSSSSLPQEKTIRVQSPVAVSFTNVGRMRLDGVRAATHAALLGRFSMAQNVYQRKSITLEQDYEFITYRRGSLLAVSHDLTQWGYSGRLKAAADVAGVITLTLDEPVPSVNPAGSSVTKMIGLRLLGETQYRIFAVNAFTGPSNTLVLSDAWPGGAVLPGSVAGEAAFECVWIYDFKATPGLKARIVSIEPTPNESGARVTLVPEPDAFWPYVISGTYLPAVNNSLLDRALPVVSNLRVTEQLARQGVNYFSRIFLTFRATGTMQRAEVWGKHGDNALQRLGVVTRPEFELQERSLAGQEWLFEVRPFDALGRLGASVFQAYTVLGKTAAPQNMLGLSLAIATNGVLATWADPSDLDPDWQASELSTSPTFAGAGQITYKRSTTHLLGWLAHGTNTIYGRHWDEERPSAAGASAAIVIARPATVVLTRSDVEANTLSVRWGDAKTSQPILRYDFRVGTTAQAYDDAAPYGSAGADSRSDVIVSQSAGTRRVWFTAVDVAGNESIPSSIDVTFSLPTDFVLASRFDATFAGSGSNVTVNDGRVYLLMLDEQDGTHFSSRSWTNDSDAIAAGSPMYFQPGTTTASYSEEYDLLAIVATMTIKFTQQVTWLVGGGTVETDIAYKVNSGDPWTTVSNVSQVIAPSLRYVKVTVRAIASGNDDLAQLVSMFTECSLRRIYEPFTLMLNAGDAGGTPYVTTAGFTDIQSATANAEQGTGIVRGPYYTIDDSGPTKQVFWLAFDNTGARVGGQISGQIAGV